MDDRDACRDDTAAAMATDRGDGGGDGGGGAGATALASQDSLASYVSSDRPIGDDALASAAAAVAEMAIDGGDAISAVAGPTRLDGGGARNDDDGADTMDDEGSSGAAATTSGAGSSSAAPHEAASQDEAATAGGKTKRRRNGKQRQNEAKARAAGQERPGATW